MPARRRRAYGVAGVSAHTSVKEDTLSRRGTFVGRTNRLANSVQTHFFDSGSAAAVGGQERTGPTLFARLAKGGGRWKTSRAHQKSNGCARRTRKLCGEVHWGGDLRAGEKVRERAGVAGEARARRISRPGDRTGEHTGTRRRRYGRAGVHTEHALKQTRRQRFGVAGRCDVHRGGDVRAGQRAGSGSVQSARLVWRRR